MRQFLKFMPIVILTFLFVTAEENLMALDMRDHPPPSGYELHIKGYELYLDGKLVDKIPPG